MAQAPDAALPLRADATELTDAERLALARFASLAQAALVPSARAALDRLVQPVDAMAADWPAKNTAAARNAVLAEVHRRQLHWKDWDQDAWASVAASPASGTRQVKYPLAALGYLLGGHHRLHHKADIAQLGKFADMVFGPGATGPALEEVRATLTSWQSSEHAMPWQVTNAVLDLLLCSGTPHLDAITSETLHELAAIYPPGRSSRRQGLFKVSRVLAHKGIITSPLTANQHHRGPQAQALATVPAGWLDWAQRWRKLSTHEPGTIRSMSSVIMTAGRWAAEKRPEAVTPDAWTRDIAAEYVADTMHATIGQWAGPNRNNARWGQELSAVGKAQRIDAVRGFFTDLIEWEWITARFDPRRVLSLPLSIRAGIGPNPRIIDDAAWAKLMAAGLTLNTEDLAPYGTPRARQAGVSATYYPVEMIRALVGVWLFGGCRIDEIRRLELDCLIWDEGTDEHTGEAYPVCLLRVPQNKTAGPFSKPVDPVAGQLIEAWKLVRPPQPDVADRKTRQRRQHLFTWRGQLIGPAYLNDKIIPALCRKAGIPESDSRGALTSHRARATIATQLLNAREPLTLPDLQQWLGHKHPSSTRHYAAILQRTLTAAYRKANYFARNVRTIQVLIDRETVMTGAAATGQPWKYYDLGDGYCSYDFFAKCPHRLACARCPFYVPKHTSAGQLLAVKDGVQQMLEQIDLTDEERAAVEGDLDALTALAKRLTNVPTPAGPTPEQLGTDRAFVALTTLEDSLKNPDK